MATVSVVRAYRASEGVPVLRAEVVASAVATSGVTSQQVGGTAGNNDEYWSVTSSGGAIWAAFGANPTAAVGDDWLILAGATREWEASTGQKLAIIDAV